MASGREVKIRMVVDTVAYVEAIKKAIEVVDRLTQTPRGRRLFGLPRRDAHHPPKLSIAGAAYHRRRNARRGRR